MANYDPKYVEKLAEDLMRKAGSIVFNRTILWTIIGAIIGAGINISFFNPGVLANNTESIAVAAILGALLFGYFGYMSAQAIVLRIRAEAQLMLTQLNIELNTRPMRNLGKKTQIPKSEPSI